MKPPTPSGDKDPRGYIQSPYSNIDRENKEIMFVANKYR